MTVLNSSEQVSNQILNEEESEKALEVEIIEGVPSGNDAIYSKEQILNKIYDTILRKIRLIKVD